jgi:hypothetical protein
MSRGGCMMLHRHLHGYFSWWPLVSALFLFNGVFLFAVADDRHLPVRGHVCLSGRECDQSDQRRTSCRRRRPLPMPQRTTVMASGLHFLLLAVDEPVTDP